MSNPKKRPLPAKPEIHLKVTEESELMKFLIAKLPQKNRNNIKSLLRNKQILVNGKVTTQFNHILQPNQDVEIKWEKIAPEKQYRGISIIYEDHDLVVIDKHAGILSIATDNETENTAYRMLSDHVKKTNPDNKIFVVHRLDKDTSGLMMFAKSQKIQELLQESWHANIVERYYIAVVEGALEKKEGEITSYLRESKALKVHSSQNPNNGDKAVTYYKVLHTNKDYSMLKVQLATGRKNQIRVHMQDIGHSIIGDKKYDSKVNPIGRLGLHALVLSFNHPITKEKLYFETKIPRKFLVLFKLSEKGK